MNFLKRLFIVGLPEIKNWYVKKDWTIFCGVGETLNVKGTAGDVYNTSNLAYDEYVQQI